MSHPQRGLPDGDSDPTAGLPARGPGGDAAALDDAHWRSPAVDEALARLRQEPGPEPVALDRIWRRLDGALVAADAGDAGDPRVGTSQRAGGDARLADAGQGAWWVAGGAVVLSSFIILALLLRDDPPSPRQVTTAMAEQRATTAAAPVADAPRVVETSSAPPAPPPSLVAAPAGSGPTDPAPAIAQAPNAAAGESDPRALRTRPSPDDALRTEVRLVEKARDALARNDPAEALRALRHHERRFASGQLVEERAALEIIAHARMSNAALALPLSVRFLDRYGSSVHAQAVREAVAALR